MARTLRTALACALIMTIAACGSGADQKAAEGLASQLATGLTAGQLGEVPIQGGGQAELDAVVAGMDGIPATVTVDTVELDGDSATATLGWQWEMPGEPWRYTTTGAAAEDRTTSGRSSRRRAWSSPGCSRHESLDSEDDEARRATSSARTSRWSPYDR